MLHIREAIVVEGRYDKNTLSQVVDTLILETAGFGIFKDRDQMALLRRAAERRKRCIQGLESFLPGYLLGTRAGDMLCLYCDRDPDHHGYAHENARSHTSLEHCKCGCLA